MAHYLIKNFYLNCIGVFRWPVGTISECDQKRPTYLVEEV